MENETTMNRRTFVKVAAVAGASLAVGPAIAGCASGSASSSSSLASLDASEDPDDNMSSDASASTSTTESASPSSSKVYFSREITADSLVKVYEALGVAPVGNVAVKLSTGEPGSNYLRPELIGDLVKLLDGTIVECNTAYGGKRGSTERHLQVAADHGFTEIADVDIMDADGEIRIPIARGKHLSEDIVGDHLDDYDWMLSLAHFKGHAMGGFGGALKNISIGVASSTGKVLIHSAGASESSWGNPAQDDFLESMAEAASAVCDYMGGNMAFVNVMNRLSVDCDCDGNPAEPQMADIGVLASLDPVALDQACVDLVYAAPDGDVLVHRMESLNGTHILDHAQEIGVGSKDYDLVEIVA